LEQELKRFFGVSSLDVDPPVLASARKANPETPFSREQRAWVAQARLLASSHPAMKYSPDRAPEMLQRLRRLAAFPKEASRVCDVLFDFGVRFVVVQPLEKSRIDGAAFWIDGSPCIALSLRYGRIDAFWFTLMHEVAHILHNDEGSVDTDLAGREQIPSLMKVDIERRADDAAGRYLIGHEEFETFIRMYSPLYSKARINRFANQVKIHPGIIIGQLQHRGELGWDSGRGTLVDVREHVTTTALTDGWGKSISPGTLE
jgi:HTH-type transcriptional regulator/antitoxin HigA